MRTLTTLATATLIAVGLAGTAAAAPPSVVITGGGVVQNNDSGLGVLTSVGGFVAIAKGDSVPGINLGAVWTDVKGQIQAKLVDPTDPTEDLSTLHGNVVCIALLAGGIEGQGDYEVRFQVTRSAGDFAVPVGKYGSLFVNDSGLPSEGGTDMADEDFSNLDEDECDVVGGFAHERLLSGNFTVH
jgi:hypothetical protein